MNNTPRTDEQINGKPCTQFGILAGDCLRNAAVPSEFARTLERELNAANSIIRQQQLLDEEKLRLQDHIKRLEEALAAYLDLLGTDGVEQGVAVVREMKDRIKRLESKLVQIDKWYQAKDKP